MIRQIAPQVFTRDLPATLAYYEETLGFNTEELLDACPWRHTLAVGEFVVKDSDGRLLAFGADFG